MVDFHKHFPGSGVGKVFPWLEQELGRLGMLKPEASILDFGCGQGGTALWLEGAHPGVTVTRYDPGVEEYNQFVDRYYDVVYTCDVLEHVPEDELPGVIAVINSVARGPTVHIIDLDPAKKTHPDGTNAHASLLTPEEWVGYFSVKMRVESAQVAVYPDRHRGERRRLHLVAQRGKKM